MARARFTPVPFLRTAGKHLGVFEGFEKGPTDREQANPRKLLIANSGEKL
jgi:hypothetical protein